jgi:hypothetical protein
MSKLWPHMSPGASAATSTRGGSSSSLPTKIWLPTSASAVTGKFARTVLLREWRATKRIVPPVRVPGRPGRSYQARPDRSARPGPCLAQPQGRHLLAAGLPSRTRWAVPDAWTPYTPRGLSRRRSSRLSLRCRRTRLLRSMVRIPLRRSKAMLPVCSESAMVTHRHRCHS